MIGKANWYKPGAEGILRCGVRLPYSFGFETPSRNIRFSNSDVNIYSILASTAVWKGFGKLPCSANIIIPETLHWPYHTSWIARS